MTFDNSTDDRLDALREAVELIVEAQTIVDQALRGTPSWNHYTAYGRYGFNQLLGNGNPYDSSLISILDTLEEE